jgi:hypothetical protein
LRDGCGHFLRDQNAEEWLEKFDHIIFACGAQNIRFQAPEYLICLQLCLNQEALYWALPIFESLLDACPTIDDVTNFRNRFLDRFENPEEEQEEEGEEEWEEEEKDEEEEEEEVDEVLSYYFDIQELSKVTSLKSIKQVDVDSTGSVGSQSAIAFFCPSSIFAFCASLDFPCRVEVKILAGSPPPEFEKGGEEETVSIRALMSVRRGIG